MSKAEDERKQRLAEALRQNLRRRKAQARGDEAVPAEPSPRHSRGSGNPDEA
jgi:ribosomal protein L39E